LKSINKHKGHVKHSICVWRRVAKVLHVAALILLAAFFLFPLVLTFTNSFMSEQEIAVNYNAVTDKSLSSYNADAQLWQLCPFRVYSGYGYPPAVI
jgi:ABC-type glycerol-3-phosphate transport system permease component